MNDRTCTAYNAYFCSPVIILFLYLSTFFFSTSCVSSETNSWFKLCPDELGGFKFSSAFDEKNIQTFETQDNKFANIEIETQNACAVRNKSFQDQLQGMPKAQIEFEGGSSNDRSSKIVNDPLNPNNKVLSFWIKNPNIPASSGHPAKGRVQMNSYGKHGFKHIKYSVSLFLHPDLSNLKQFPKLIDWMTLSEWWNNIVWNGQEYPFRMTVNLYKDYGLGNPINFQIKAHSFNYNTRKWEKSLWEEVNRDFSIPFGKWMLLEYEIFEGDKSHGRFLLHVTTDSGERKTIFDIHDYTHHPDDPNPDGISHFNPVKLYTSDSLINFIRSLDGNFQVFWDNMDMLLN